MQIFAIRLKPNDDLKANLGHFVKQHQIEAGFMITAVGSLKPSQISLSQSFKRHKIKTDELHAHSDSR